jgi:hypothetical protein
MAALKCAGVIGVFAAMVFVLGMRITTWSEEAT